MKLPKSNINLPLNSTNSRRNFCKNSMLATGALVLPNFGLQGMYNTLNNKKLKIAVVGCGGRGTGAASQALQADENVVLVAMADAFEDQLKNCYDTLAKEFEGTKKIDVPKKRQFVGFDAAKKAIDEADVVILATPPGFRPQHFEYAVAAGKHVFMEKPVATDVPGVRRVLEAAKKAKENKLNVVVGLQRHYQNNYIEVAKRLHTGEMGKIVSGQVYWNNDGVWVYKRQPNQSELEYQMRNWYYFNWLCGDHILEQHIHNIDVANWFLNEYPVSAQGMGGRQVRTGKEYGEIFDHHFVEFTYPSGAVISSQCRHQPNTMNKVGEIFQTTKGSIEMKDAGTATVTGFGGEELFKYRTEKGHNPYQEEHFRLFEAIRSGSVIADGENGAKSTLTAIMGRMATYTGKVIDWDTALQSNQILVPEDLTWDSPAPVLPKGDGFYAIPTPGETEVI